MALERLEKLLRASAISDKVPPSPRLSARSTKPIYLTVTMMVSAQTMSDNTPSTASRDATPSPEDATSASRNA